MKMNIRFNIFILMVLCLAEAKLPSYIHVCKKSDPNLAKCIIDSVYSLKPKLANGIPELNVPSAEPLLLEKIQLRTGQSRTKIDANLTNLQVWGVTSFEILELRPDVTKNRFIFKSKVPHIYFKGDYDLNMDILLLKYKGQGPLSGNFTDLSLDAVLKGHITKINGVDHIQFRKFGVHVEFSHTKIELSNLFDNQRNLGNATNQVLNENSEVLLTEIKPALENALASKFTDIANNICKTFSYNELFPN
ncbi:protein takeout-like [Diorhabda sublineata]|uniref:protein takeout-like n=1 Tax=Diorhabda sublineata TaxID=1163346 RepID=UPI0024E0F7D6|nr:protein takeout-like [Diorhabda sublineata]